jgi:hypothetical protein
MRNRPRTNPFKNSRAEARLCVNPWSVRGCFFSAAKVNTLRHLPLKSGDNLIHQKFLVMEKAE